MTLHTTTFLTSLPRLWPPGFVLSTARVLPNVLLLKLSLGGDGVLQPANIFHLTENFECRFQDVTLEVISATEMRREM